VARDIWAFIWIHCFPFSNFQIPHFLSPSFSHFHIFTFTHSSSFRSQTLRRIPDGRFYRMKTDCGQGDQENSKRGIEEYGRTQS